MHYYKTGDYMDFQKTNFSRRHKLRDLVTAECIEGYGRFIDDIVDGIWLLCEESFWGLPPNTWVRASEEDQVENSNQKLDTIRTVLPDIERPGVDLWVGETAGVLAWTAYLLKDQLDAISPLIVDRVIHEVKARVLDPCLDRNFLWMGFLGQEVGNWNPWCNSNWLTCILLLEPDESRRQQAVEKSLLSLDHFLNTYGPDGGCNEGPSYWGRAVACLFDCLELLNSATGGSLDLYDQPLIQEMAAYIYRVHIDERYYVNFADAPGSIGISSDLVYRLGVRVGDNRLKEFGAWAARNQESTFAGSLIRELPALFNAAQLKTDNASAPLARDAWLLDIQVKTARSREGTSDGLYLAVKGGHNREHHNHNDVGNFIIYTDGLPAIIDAGVGTYTRKNSGPDRYDIWTMKSGYHNLPTIDGMHQGYGREFSARVIDQSSDDFSSLIQLDIAEAYPPEAGIESWTRTLTLNRSQDVRLEEAYVLTDSPRELTLSLITPCKVSIGSDVLHLETRIIDSGRQSGALDILYDPAALVAHVEEIEMDDPKLQASWGKKLFRILLRVEQPEKQGNWSLLFKQRG
jgi:hypothetical protein